MEQRGDSLHFFGSGSRNSSRRAQPFTCDTSFKSLTPAGDRQQLCSTANTTEGPIGTLESSRPTWMLVLISSTNKIPDRARGVFLSHTPKNKGPCVRSSVCVCVWKPSPGTQHAFAERQQLLAWYSVASKEATALKWALFVHRLSFFPPLSQKYCASHQRLSSKKKKKKGKGHMENWCSRCPA